jgi:hypothetical protein
MKKQIFAIRDSKAEMFNDPFLCNTHGEAERSLKTAVNDKQSAISKYPEDFDLYHLGTYDTNSGKIETPPSPNHLIKANQLVGE